MEPNDNKPTANHQGSKRNTKWNSNGRQRPQETAESLQLFWRKSPSVKTNKKLPPLHMSSGKLGAVQMEHPKRTGSGRNRKLRLQRKWCKRKWNKKQLLSAARRT